MKEDITLYNDEKAMFAVIVTKKGEIKKILPEHEMIIIDTKGNEKETRRIIESLKKEKKIIGVIAHANSFNRRVLETMNIQYLIGIESFVKKHSLKQRDSGLNHVTARIAAKKGIRIVINAGHLQSLEKKEKAETLSQIIQNLQVTRKEKTSIAVASLAQTKQKRISSDERKNLLLSLGASTPQIVKATNFS